MRLEIFHSALATLESCESRASWKRQKPTACVPQSGHRSITLPPGVGLTTAGFCRTESITNKIKIKSYRH